MFTPVYDEENRKTLKALAIEEHNRLWTYNIFLKRNKAYNPKGRNHTEKQAKELDFKILDILDEANAVYDTFDGNVIGKDRIVEKIHTLLKYKKQQNS